ncbi:thioesterase family protein [Hyphomonas adhaerens]|uniref:thioesterase family protein n=1 Tax=Hyphomonas adhaerens TaxID=81029 RepID=UPI0023571F6B|nr:thioesterase family protein [Hyphomonas adhaerens]
MKTLWRGSCNQWDCDEMGHMNVRVYVEKQMEGLAVFAHALGMPHAFRQNSPSTITPVDQHIRFVREVLPGRPLTMHGCLIEVGEADALVYQELRHADGQLAAAFRTRIMHIDTAGREPFPWGKSVRAAMADDMDTPPEESAPRSIDPVAEGLPYDDISVETPRKLGIACIGMGAVPPQHLDVHGRMSPAWVIGRISDSVPNLLFGWRKDVAAAAGDLRMGAAVLEYRIRYHDMPQAGDRFEVYTGLGGVEGKTHSLFHWMMDPVTGKPWATSQATAITLDLDARKAIPAPAMAIEELERLAPKGLEI